MPKTGHVLSVPLHAVPGESPAPSSRISGKGTVDCRERQGSQVPRTNISSSCGHFLVDPSLCLERSLHF